MSEDTFRWIVTAGVAIATLCIVVQAIVMIVLLRVATKVTGVVTPLLAQAKPIMADARPLIAKVTEVVGAAKPIVQKVDGLVAKAAPIMVSVAAIVEEMRPKIAKISSDAVEIAHVGKDQVQNASVVVTDFLGRARTKVERVDHAVDQTVEQVQLAGEAVKRSVLRPVRGVEGLVAGVKAGISTYASGRRPTVDHVTQDEEMFI